MHYTITMVTSVLPKVLKQRKIKISQLLQLKLEMSNYPVESCLTVLSTVVPTIYSTCLPVSQFHFVKMPNQMLTVDFL